MALCVCVCPLAFANDGGADISAEKSVAADIATVEGVVSTVQDASSDSEDITAPKQDVDEASGDQMTVADSAAADNVKSNTSADSALAPSAGSMAPKASDEEPITKEDAPSLATVDGWNVTDSGSMYYENGQAVRGEKCIDGHWFYFDPATGLLAHGWQWISDYQKWVYYDAATGAMKYGEQYLTPEAANNDGAEHWYYLDDITGARLYGWKYIESDAKWVHYDSIMGWRDAGEHFVPCGNNPGDAEHWYYFDEATGATQYGWKYIESDAKWVHYDSIMGWRDAGEHFVPCGNNPGDAEHWYYFDEATGATQYGWKYIESDAKWVHYDSIMGWMDYDEQCVPCNNNEGADLHWYYFDPVTGAAHYGWTWVKSAHKGVFYDEVNAWMMYGWLEYQGKRYHLDEVDGHLESIFSNSIVVDRFVNWALGIAADDSHGYDQQYRWNERGDYDCSSLVVSALRQAGLDTGGATYTGNMVSNLTARGFQWITDFSQLQYGDILLNQVQHTAIYLGNNLLVHASGNEYGGAIGGKPGDQTGSEICVRSYYWKPWDGFLRYVG
ncbi:NlpC/P60 family protein [uncultured Senegalimassilia sp.]|uniref:NlpC/P60 family protein n=1 Tax=uncultured Senegalimassilia sp. TaxID=1714350 RepID=UPI0025D0A7E6|nr:NlpC/P60 family protein [uncultured Senegalimassilia sp.]